MPGARTFASGTVRFWWNAWFNEAQIGGGSEQGLLNPYLMPMYWEVMLGPEVTPTIQYLQTFGVDAIIVHEEHSKSGLKDFVYPKKFRGALPVIYDNGQGDIIYRIPRRYPGLARVVDTRKALSIPPVHPDRAARNIEAYSALIERGPEAPVSTAWEGNGVLRIRARVAAGQSVLVQTSHDPCWRAYSGGRSLSVKKDVMGQMLIEAPPGEHDLRLVFEPPFENFIGRIVTVLALAACLALFAAAARQREVPA